MPLNTLDYQKLDNNLGNGPVPLNAYVSKEHYQREIDNIFTKSWLQVATVDEIPNNGDYKVKRLEFAKTSIIMIRGKDGEIRAFHNMCSHRGNKVIPEDEHESFGNVRSGYLTCRFHGWVFDAKGDLVSVPLENQFSTCFKKSENGLTPIHCDIWKGFVFINLTRGEVQPLHEYLGPYGEHFSGFPFEELTQGFHYHTILNTNWKVAMDAFAEGYHVSTLHAGSLGHVAKCGVGGVRFYGPHATSSVYFDMKSRSNRPTQDVVYALPSNKLIWTGSKQPMLEMAPNLNPDRLPNFAFELTICFPNLLLHAHEGGYGVHQFWPISHDKTLWEGRGHMVPNKRNSDIFASEYNHIIARSAWLEDTGTMENTYQAMLSGAKDQQWLMDEEILIRRNLAVIEKMAAA